MRKAECTRNWKHLMADTGSTTQCGRCGADTDANATLCTSCGALLAAYAPVSPPTNAIAPYVPYEPLNADIPRDPSETIDSINKKRSGSPRRQTTDWRDIFTKPVIHEPAPSVPDVNPPAPVDAKPAQAVIKTSPRPKPMSNVVPMTQPAPSKPSERAKSRLPARTPSSSPSPDPPLAPDAGQPRQKTTSPTPSLALAGAIVMISSCVLAVSSSAVSENGLYPGLAVVCVLPIGLIMVIVGIVLHRRRTKKGAQTRV
jgi:hypothetical protein